MLVSANKYPDFWYLSFVALIPFLYKASRISGARAIKLGFLFGLIFCTLSNIDIVYSLRPEGFFNILLGISVFVLFSFLVSRISSSIGFNPVIIATLWVLLELTLFQLGYSPELLTGTTAGGRLVQKTSIIFGLVSISFIVLLINGLLIAGFDRVLGCFKVKANHVGGSSSVQFGFFDRIHIFNSYSYQLPFRRAPPAALYLCAG